MSIVFLVFFWGGGFVSLFCGDVKVSRSRVAGF